MKRAWIKFRFRLWAHRQMWTIYFPMLFMRARESWRDTKTKIDAMVDEKLAEFLKGKP